MSFMSTFDVIDAKSQTGSLRESFNVFKLESEKKIASMRPPIGL
jgi:hypothetical protein